MAEGTLTKVGEQVRQNPVANRLKDELEDYLEARLQLVLEGVGERLSEGASRLAEARVGPGLLSSVALKAGKKLLERAPSGEVLGSLASQAKEALTGAAQGRREKRPSATAKGLMIVEEVNVGVPVREAYDQWTQFTEFDRFTKGVQNVEQDDEISSRWQVRIAKVRRHWRGIVTEQVPDERIAWTSEGPKGTTKGVVSFHPLGENLTKVLLVLQYFPKGVVERVGTLWRAQGRRVRLDLKLYRAFIMARGEATGAWRGEIRDGEVVRGPEEVAEEDREERSQARDEDERYPEDEEEEEEGEEEPGERYEDEDEEEEDEEEEPEERYAEDEQEGDEEEEEDESEYAPEEPDKALAGRRRRG
ncbi:SRPBCC family protein [Streptomyces sp. NPDC001795]|uniref:SRPBCC family protein n=1 Tax=Streptomyces sp. NPDC001795 TaxID=3154525 RepID=UPI003331D399